MRMNALFAAHRRSHYSAHKHIEIDFVPEPLKIVPTIHFYDYFAFLKFLISALDIHTKDGARENQFSVI